MWSFLPVVALAAEPEPPPAETVPAWQSEGLGWGALPAINFSTDEGFGFGALGSLYGYDGATQPYRWSTTALFFMTTRGVHSHFVKFDLLDVAHKPLRIDGRARFELSRTAAYCGVGNAVTCDPDVAVAAADEVGLEGEEKDAFVANYYRYRFIQPGGYLNARYRIDPKPHEVSVLTGWRGYYLFTADLTGSGPYPGSLYAQAFPDGEEGMMSILQAGIVFDDRDFEPAPTRGYWVEASVRGASRFWGSAWEHFGFDLTARSYQSIVPDRLVLATRLAFDGIVGDAPVIELAVPGGIQEWKLVGGKHGGRGILERKFIGRVKAIAQPELRLHVVEFRVGAPIDLGLVAFVDVGHVASDWAHLAGDDPGRLLVGEGGGLRVQVADSFVVRADVGVSAADSYAPGVYIDIDNLF